VKEIWTGRLAHATQKYGENAPTAAVCCNACRTCVTTNLLAVIVSALAATGAGLARFTRRFAHAS
jgi:hypothetical protein